MSINKGTERERGEKLNVLSLFDGISCGQIALERAGIEVNKYFASEIKKSAIQVTMEHYPNTIQLGDVRGIKGEDLPTIDLLIGGSPCQNLSQARTIQGQDRDGLTGDKSSLFFEYVRLLKEVNPKFFLLENVVMPKEDEEMFTRLLGVEPIRINSKLVSYQQRDRLYWTNIPGIEQPEDKNINFQDYKDTDPEYCRKFKVKRTPSREKMWAGACPNVTHREKINCITVKQDRWKNSGLVEFEDFCRYLTTRELEIGQTLPVGYTKSLSKSQAENVIGDGWTVDVIAHIFQSLKAEIYATV